MDTLVVILSWAVCGLIVGLIARFLVPRGPELGIGRTILLGILRACVGGLIGRVLNAAPPEPLSFSASAWRGWVFAIIGAVLVLLLYSAWERRRSRTRWW